MALESNPYALAVPTQQNAIVEEPLPFSDLVRSDLVHLFPGSRISSIKENPRKYYGPVTIRSSSLINIMLSIAKHLSRELYSRSCEKDFASL